MTAEAEAAAPFNLAATPAASPVAGAATQRCRDADPAGLPLALRGGPARGQGLVEYGLILALVAVVCVVSLLFFGDQLSSLLSLIAEAI